MLKEALSSISADASAHGTVRPRVVLLGDLVGRGPDTKGALDVTTSSWFEDGFDACALLGNHELFTLAALDGRIDFTDFVEGGGKATIGSYGVDVGDRMGPMAIRFRDAVPLRHVRFMSSMRLSTRVGDDVFVHAGIDPKVPLGMQSVANTTLIRKGFLDHEGDFGFRVIHGHSPTRTFAVERRTNRIAIDTWCGFPNGRLSVLAVSTDGEVRASVVHQRTAGASDSPARATLFSDVGFLVPMTWSAEPPPELPGFDA